MKNIFTLLCCFSSILCLHAQAPIVLQSGKLRAEFGPGGALASPTFDHFLSYQVTESITVPLAFEAGILAGGIDAGENLVFHESRGESNISGVEGETDLPIDHWRVTAEQIEAHRADFEDNGVIDNPIDAVFAWPGFGNAFFADYNGFEFAALTNNLYGLANFWDTNSNGVYEPDQGDFPVLEIRGCVAQLENAIIPAEMIFFPFVNNSFGGSNTLEYQLTAFRIDCEEPDAAVSNSIFLSYRIINKGQITLTDTHFGFFMDGDIGCPTDDYVGFFPERSAAYFYNADAEDESCFGLNSFLQEPPALGVDLFRTPLNEVLEETGVSTAMPINNASLGNFPPGTTDYNTIAEAYNYLQGIWRDGSPLVNEGIGYGDEGEETDFAFDGNPATGEGWSEASAGNPPGDRRIILSSAPFVLFPGSVNEMIVALSYSREPGLSHLEQVTALRDRTDDVQGLFDSCFEVSENTVGFTGCSPVVTSLNGEPTFGGLRWGVFPNPAAELITIDLPIDMEEASIELYNTQGQRLKIYEARAGQQQLDLRSLPRGLYYLRLVLANGQQHTKRITIQ